MERLVRATLVSTLSFFEQRIFGPLRIERLEKQLRANAREQRKEAKLAGTRIRKQIAELDRKIKAQIQALEKGIEPELVSERIAELRGEKEALEEALAEVGAEREEAEAEELSEQLARVPDLTEALRDATPEVQRQVFEAFELQALRQGGAPDRDPGHGLGGRRQRLREEESPPEGGLLGGTERHSGAGFEPATFGL